jgi:hypothetical protein
LPATIDAADYTVWRDHLGSPTSLPNDDTAGVGPDDYARWKTHFGETSGSGALVDTVVPEPDGLLMVALCSTLIETCRRRRSKFTAISVAAG